MKIFNISFNRFRLLALFGVMSAIALLLLTMRIFKTHSWWMSHLAWNLFLGWIPIFLVFWAERQANNRWKVILISALWLLFFPNSPYIITDLVHLRPVHENLFWHDVLMLFTFAFVSLTCGMLSLYWIQKVWTKVFSLKISRLMVLAVMPLTGYGIYLGRIQRWNSWDILTNPKLLIINAMMSARSSTAWIMTMEFALVLGCMYLFFITLLQYQPEKE